MITDAKRKYIEGVLSHVDKDNIEQVVRAVTAMGYRQYLTQIGVLKSYAYQKEVKALLRFGVPPYGNSQRYFTDEYADMFGVPRMIDVLHHYAAYTRAEEIGERLDHNSIANCYFRAARHDSDGYYTWNGEQVIMYSPVHDRRKLDGAIDESVFHVWTRTLDANNDINVYQLKGSETFRFIEGEHDEMRIWIEPVESQMRVQVFNALFIIRHEDAEVTLRTFGNLDEADLAMLEKVIQWRLSEDAEEFLDLALDMLTNVSKYEIQGNKLAWYNKSSSEWMKPALV